MLFLIPYLEWRNWQRAGLKIERQFFRNLPQPTAQIRKDLHPSCSLFRRLTQTSALFLILWLQISQRPALAQEHRTYVVPFHTSQGLIVLDGQINGKPAALLLDTGANISIADYRAAGFPALKLDALRSTGKTGAEGDCLTREIPKLSLGLRSWLNRRVSVMDLSDVSRRMGVCVDGFIGADALRKSSSVRIDYKHGIVEFEQ